MSTSPAVSSKLLLNVGLGLGVTVTVLSGATYCYYKFCRRDVMPAKWRRVGILEQINLFPIKSCGPLELQASEELECGELGMRWKGCLDRSLMLVDEDNTMITARVYPQMVLIACQMVDSTKLRLSAPNMDPLVLDYATLAAEAAGRSVRTTVYGTKLDVLLCGERYDRWISQALLSKDKGLKLVYFPYTKPVRSIVWYFKKQPFITREDWGTFTDATTYMLMNLASVEDLNTRLTRKVDALQFRGNFHLKTDTGEPYAEDNWGWIKIGEAAVFRVLAPCVRCIVPNINPLTGERDPEGEPLRTLKSYRKHKNFVSPPLGLHLGIRQPGVIKANDVIYIEDNGQ